jgi:hypothetical protein
VAVGDVAHEDDARETAVADDDLLFSARVSREQQRRVYDGSRDSNMPGEHLGAVPDGGTLRRIEGDGDP